MHYPIQTIAEIVGGKFLNAPPLAAVVEHLLLDSRQVTFPASSLFIALKGRAHDGHQFLESLYQQGVRNFLVSRLPGQPGVAAYPAANFLLVENTQAAFHKLANHHRHQFGLPVVGITGSNGKTIVKEWLFQLLHEDYHIVRSPKSFNSQTGVPLSVLQIKEDHTLALFEAGVSQAGEMAKLAPILDPDIGVFTNIGEAHSEGFTDLVEKLREKRRLFERCKALIYCVDNDLVEQEMQALQDKTHFTWSAGGKKARLQITERRQKAHLTILDATLLPEGQPVSITIPFTDDASVENAAHCWALMLHLGFDNGVVAERMLGLEPVAMRLELKEGLNGCTVINDSYNSDLTSLSIALHFLEQQSKAPKRTLILSDIFQSGQLPEELYGTVAKLLLEKRIDRLIGVGTAVPVLKRLLPPGFDAVFYENTPALLGDFKQLSFQHEIILLKGARSFGFEQVANRLSVKYHKTVLEVNLGALLHNLRAYQAQLRPGTKMMVMVKAGAYGSGSAEVAKLLEFQHVDYLGVAYADEGVVLRKAGIQLPIMVMNPEVATFEALVRYRLEPEIYSLGLLENFLSFVAKYPPEQQAAIHLKLDTGMHRLGFEEKDLEKAIELLVENDEAAPRRAVVKTIFTHLAASEAPSHDAFTHEQAARFNKMYERLAARLGYRPLRHILNSGGIVRFPAYQMDMVRLGIGLYGVDSSRILQSKLQTVNTLKATISQVKQVAGGETVGYGRMGKAEAPMRIATLSIGYADGLLRRAGNGRYSVLVHGKKAPLFGNVCMDMVMADVTDIPQAAGGDTVEVFGAGNPVQALAECLGTIPYEIFTSISERVKRVYVQD